MRAHALLPLLCLALAGPAPAESPCERGYRIQRAPAQVGSVAPALTEDERWQDAILREAGCRWRLLAAGEAQSVDRLHVLIRDGSLDLRAQASALPEREAYAYFTIPYRTERVRLYAHRRHAGLLTGLKLADVAQTQKPLLAQAQGWFGPEFASLKPDLARAGLLVEFKSAEQAASLIRADRGTVLLATDSMAGMLLDRRVDLVRQEAPVYENPVSLMLSRATHAPADVERLNAAIRRLTARGFVP